MNILAQLTIRNLRLNRKRTIVTLIGIILSGALICGVASLIASFQDAMIRETIRSSGSHHAELRGIAYENTKYVANHANTEKYAVSRELGFAYLEGSKNTGRPYLWVHAFDETAFATYPVYLKEGRIPEAPGEIAVSESTLLSSGVKLNIGDTLTLRIGQRTDADGNIIDSREELTKDERLAGLQEYTFTITGILEQPNIEFYPLPAYGAVAYLDPSTLSAEDKVTVSITAKNPKHIYSMVKSLTSTLRPETISYNSELLRWMGITNNRYLNDMFNAVGLIIILLVMVGSISVIYNAFAISVSERKKQFGMLASIGATARQIRRIVFLEAAFLGLIGIPIGILSGIGGIWVTLEIVNELLHGSIFNSAVELRLAIQPITIWVSVFFIGLTIFLSAYIPAKRAARISPIEAIRQTTDINIKGKKLRTSKLTRVLFGFEGELAIKNLKRHRKRYRATVFSLFISIVLYVSFSSFMTYGFASSEMYYKTEPYDFRVIKSDIPVDEIYAFYDQVIRLSPVERPVIDSTLYFKAEGLSYDQLGDYLQNLMKLKKLDASEPPGQAAGQEENESSGENSYSLDIKLQSVGEAELNRYAQQLGIDLALLSAKDKPRGILVNYSRSVTLPITEYEPLNIRPGEALTLRAYPTVEAEEQESFTIEIAAISYEKPFTEYHSGGPEARIVVTDDWFQQLMKQYVPESRWIETPVLYMTVAEGTDLKAFADEIRMVDASMNPNGRLHIWDAQTDREQTNRMKIVLSIFLYGFVSLITLIGVTNIFNTISTNVALRRREFAMLRSIGMTPAGFKRMLNYECIFYGLKSLLYGLPAGIAVSYWLYNSISGVFYFNFTLPWREIGICTAGVFIIVFLTMMHSSSKLKKENIIDAMKMENL